MEKFNLDIDCERGLLINKDKASVQEWGKYSKSNLQEEEMSTLKGQEEFPFPPGINYDRMAMRQNVKNL